VTRVRILFLSVLTLTFAAPALYAQTIPVTIQGVPGGTPVLVTEAAVKFEDDPATSGDKVIPIAAVRVSTCGSPSAGTTGDYIWFNVDANGNLCTVVAANNAGSATVTEAATEPAAAANTAIVSAYLKAFDGTTFSRVRGRSGLIGSSDFGMVTRPFAWSDGTNTAPTMDAAARAGFQKVTDGTNTLVLDPCQGNAKVYTPISQTANTKLITGTASKKTFVCSIVLVGADAENISLVAGTGSTCGTSTVAVLGGATAANGPNLAANGGFSFGSGLSSIAATTVNQDDLCLFQSGSGRVAGVMTSVVQ
jgi:hypothetical protein